ncbi:60S ribosomal protein L31 [archaeon]|nr:60S ribosomal protein L31 [archaeon]
MERIYNIPLRKEFQKAPRYKKTSKAMRAVKEFLTKHMKAKEVKIGKYLNEELWKNGPKNPPHKVNVKAVKEEDIVKAELVGAPVIEAPEPTKKTIKEKLEEKVGTKKESSEEKTPTAKKLTEKKKKKEEKTPIAKELEKKEETPTTIELKEKKESIKKEDTKSKIPTAKELKDKKSSKK